MLAKRERSDIMLAKPFNSKIFDKMPAHVVFQPKLDGARIRAVWNINSNRYDLFSSTGRFLESLPHIESALNRLERADGCHLTFDGEAYNHNMRLQEIMSIVSKTKSVDPAAEQLEFHIFDIISKRNQLPRIYDLEEIPLNGCLKRVPSTISDKQNLSKILIEYVKEGYEGAIIRDPRSLYLLGKQSCILKIKPTHQDEYLIVGCTEAISIEGKPKGMVGAFNLVDSLGNHFQSSAGRLNHIERAAWWKLRHVLPGHICVVKYQELTARGVPREPVTMEVRDA